MPHGTVLSHIPPMNRNQLPRNIGMRPEIILSYGRKLVSGHSPVLVCLPSTQNFPSELRSFCITFRTSTSFTANFQVFLGDVVGLAREGIIPVRLPMFVNGLLPLRRLFPVGGSRVEFLHLGPVFSFAP